jgi:hypothetical protein
MQPLTLALSRKGRGGGFIGIGANRDEAFVERLVERMRAAL